MAQSFRTVPYAHADAAPLLLLGQVLSTCYLHREIREKGGAYGGELLRLCNVRTLQLVDLCPRHE